MATKLFHRSTSLNAIGVFHDMVTTAGSASTTSVVNTAASGTEIQWTQTAGGAVCEFISGRVPAGGFTLAGTMTFSIWAHESNMNANCGARARVFKRTAGGTETEIGGGPWDDGVEFGTAAAEMTWTGTPTSTAFAEDDRIVVRFYITNIGTMASGHTCTLTYNAADAATGDSFFQINETVSFKPETVTVPVTAASLALSEQAVTVNAKTFVPVTAVALALGGQAVTIRTVLAVTAAALALAGQAVTVNAKMFFVVTAAALVLAGQTVLARVVTTVTAAAAQIVLAAQAVAVTVEGSGRALLARIGIRVGAGV